MSKLPEHISYSSLGTYQECGWKYNLTKIQGVPEQHAVWFTAGSAVHRATEMWDLNPGDAESIWNDAWYKQVKEDEELNGDMGSWQYIKREDMSFWYGEGLWMLDRWIELRSNGWNIYKDYIEKQYEVPLGDTTVKMAIDRVMTDFDGNVVLLDIKTGASSQRHPLQLATYAWALRKMDGIEVDKAGFWDARTGQISLWNLEHLSTQEVEHIYSEFDRARKAEIFLPNLSNCGRCGVLSYCKFMNGKYTEKEKSNG